MEEQHSNAATPAEDRRDFLVRAAKAGVTAPAAALLLAASTKTSAATPAYQAP